MRDEIFKETVSQLLALIAFFAFPALQYISLKWFSRKEGEPELWYLPRYACFRLVIRNIPGTKPLSELKCRAFVRKVIPRAPGAQVGTYIEDVLTHDESFFLFPGTDQVILCFRIEDRPDQSHLSFVLTDKIGTEKRQVRVSDINFLIADYSATLENFLNFDVKLAKRVQIEADRFMEILEFQKQHPEHEGRFPLTKEEMRSVG